MDFSANSTWGLCFEACRLIALPRISSRTLVRPFVEAEATVFDNNFDRALASILRTKCSLASGDPGNTGEIGDIYQIPPKLWLVRNEVGGWTAMYPEDY